MEDFVILTKLKRTLPKTAQYLHDFMRFCIFDLFDLFDLQMTSKFKFHLIRPAKLGVPKIFNFIKFSV